MKTPITFAPLDYGLIGLYFAALIGIGIATAVRRRRAGVAENEDYMVAGRTLTLPAFVATLVATWYGGILGVGELSYTSGLVTWTVFGLPYYLFAVVYALFLAKRVRTASRLTIPDTLQAAYGRPCALIGAAFVFLLVTPAPYTLMLGELLHDIFGWPLLTAIILGTLLSIGFVVTGGFNNDIRTNLLQFVLMFASFAIILGFAMARHGGISFLAVHLPPKLTQAGGGLPLTYILVWYFIALWTLVDPGFHQRCSAARDARTARNGILVAVGCWAVFDFLTVTTGLYARALLPRLEPAVQAYPVLSQVLLPAGVKGFFWVGMLATVMSTVLSYTFIAAITLGRDVVWRVGSQSEAPLENDVLWTRVGVVLTSVLSILAAYRLPSVVSLWYVIGTAFIPGLLLPLLTAYTRLRVPAAFMFAAMVLGTGLPVLWMVLGARAGGLGAVAVGGGHYPGGIEPMYVGLAASLVVWTVGWLHCRAVTRRTLLTRAEPGGREA